MSNMVYLEGKDDAFVIEGNMEKVVEYIKDEFKLMTGQEWYDRFKTEFGKPPHSDHLMCARIICADHSMTAAKKASGLE